MPQFMSIIEFFCSSASISGHWRICFPFIIPSPLRVAVVFRPTLLPPPECPFISAKEPAARENGRPCFNILSRGEKRRSRAKIKLARKHSNLGPWRRSGEGEEDWQRKNEEDWRRGRKKDEFEHGRKRQKRRSCEGKVGQENEEVKRGKKTEKSRQKGRTGEEATVEVKEGKTLYKTRIKRKRRKRKGRKCPRM